MNETRPIASRRGGASGGGASGGGMPTCMTLETPIGPLLLEGDDHAVTYIHLPDTAPAHRAANGSRPAARGAGTSPAGAPTLPGPLRSAARQLEEYFAGKRRTFSLPLAPSGTPFQVDVWHALADIPYGETITYGELARRVGRPSAFRAVGQANGANPLPIVYPCHRVVASGGLGGYGGGLDVKRRLLALEGVVGV